jgi:hypothetical protein
MEDSRYKTERSRPKSRIGLTGILGGFIGAGGGLVSGLAYGTAKEFVLYELPSIVQGKDIATALSNSILHGYSFAADTAIVCGVLGMLLAMKFRDAISYALRGK